MYYVWLFQSMTPKVHVGECLCGTGSVSLWLCICAIIVSMNHLMGCEYFQVFIYKLACVPMWVSSSVCLGSCVYELGCVCMCVCLSLPARGVGCVSLYL